MDKERFVAFRCVSFRCENSLNAIPCRLEFLPAANPVDNTHEVVMEILVACLLLAHFACYVMSLIHGDRSPAYLRWRIRGGISRDGLLSNVEEAALLSTLTANFFLTCSLLHYQIPVYVPGKPGFSIESFLSPDLSVSQACLWLLTLDVFISCFTIYGFFRMRHIWILLPMTVPALGGALCLLRMHFWDGSGLLPEIQLLSCYFIVSVAYMPVFRRWNRHWWSTGARTGDDDGRDAGQEPDDPSWFDFEDSSYAQIKDPALSLGGYDAWNSARFEKLRSIEFSTAMLRCVFVPMGYAGANSSSEALMQQLCFDEIIYQLGLDEATASKAWEHIDEGRKMSAGLVKAVVADGLESISRRTPTASGAGDSQHAVDNLAAEILSAAATILFFDQNLTVDERMVFYRLGQFCGLSKYRADAVFSDLRLVFNLSYDSANGEYWWQSSVNHTWSTEADKSGEGSAGQREDSRYQEETLRQREEFNRQEEKSRREYQEEQKRQEENRRKFQDGQRRQHEKFRREQEEQRQRYEKRRREQEEQFRDEGRSKRRWWWSRFFEGDEADDGIMTSEEAYRTLQCTPEDSDENVRRTWRRLAARYHPDRSVARGADAEELARVTAIAAKINAAWDVVRKERNL